MPATIPSHPAAVLPLKLARPHRFDGVALVVGSAAPDLGYLPQGLGIDVPSHAWHSLFWFSLPLTLLIATWIRRAAPAVAAHLPGGGSFALRDYGVLATVRHPLRVSAASALLGAFSHLAWDSITHPYVLFLHPFVDEVAGLPWPWWRVILLTSEVIGCAVAVAVALRIGRGRLLLAWHGPAPEAPRRPAVFWPVAGLVLAALVAVALATPGNDTGPNVIGIRLIAAAALALLAAAAAVTFVQSSVRAGR